MHVVGVRACLWVRVLAGVLVCHVCWVSGTAVAMHVTHVVCGVCGDESSCWEGTCGCRGCVLWCLCVFFVVFENCIVDASIFLYFL